MRACLSIVIVLAACGKKAEAPASEGGSAAKPVAVTPTAPPAGGSATGSAAPPAAKGACLVSDSQNKLSALVADASHATICVARQDLDKPDAPPVETCVKLEYATGAFTSATKTKPTKEPQAVVVEERAGKIEVCRPGHCMKLDLPKPKPAAEGGDPEKWLIAAHPDGFVAAATGGGSNALLIFKVDTGKRTKTVPWREGDYKCIEAPRFLGDTLYVPANVCAGPGGAGFLFDQTGKKLGQVPEINVYGATPISVGGDNYAFADFGGSKIAVVDVKTAKLVKLVEDPRPDPCDECDSLLGDAASWTASGVAKRPDGKLVIVGPTIALIDPVAGKVEKSFRHSICKAK